MSAKAKLASEASLPFKTKNKDKRQSYYLKQKKAKESVKRDERFRRKREENKEPRLRAERRARNVPVTIDKKRVWDEVEGDEGDGLGLSIDVERLKRQRVDSIPEPDQEGLTEENLKKVESVPPEGVDPKQQEEESPFSEEDDLASLLSDIDHEDSADEQGIGQEKGRDAIAMPPPSKPVRGTSPTASTTSTNLSLIPDALAAKFPTLFKPTEEPKILITTSLNGTIHREAETFTTLFPNSHYVPRTRHRYNSHHFSLREISKFASSRDYTTLIVVVEDQKRPSGLDIIHLPAGPMFHFSISNWVEGKKLPGHGNPTNHYPELILNNFRTPLGLLTAHMFRTMFPPQPELEGRQVITLHNQRDYIFVRRHRYIFRDKRPTEKAAVGSDGQAMKGAEDIRAGLQELGPRFTLKLRRIDKGIQRASGQEWEWKAGSEKERTKFQL